MRVSDGLPDRTPARNALLAIAAFVAVLPLIQHGCSCGHDFDFHLLSWMEAARQFNRGTLHPHWAFTPAFNAGEPRFVFYPPLSWYLGALIGLTLTHLPRIGEASAWNAAPIVFTWIALTASGLSLFRLARRYTGANAALLGAAVYLANPYMLFTAYERTAYAELLAAAWIPLLYDAILRERVTVPRVALPVALLWLTNAPAAVMGSYTLALLAAVRIFEMLPGERGASGSWATRHSASLRLAANTAAGTALGLALAGFYLLPAEYERRFVQIAMATIAGMRIDENFLFEHTGTSADALLHDQVLHTASLIAVLMLSVTIVALLGTLIRRGRQSERTFPVLPLALVTGGIAFLLTPLSRPIWSHAPEAAFLQFPWRLLAMLAPVLALALSVMLDRIGMKLLPAAIGCLALSVALSQSAYVYFRQPCDAEDTATARLALFHSNQGTDPTDEYTPVAADNDALKQGSPPYWLAPSAESAPPASAQPGATPLHVVLDAPRAEYLILNLRDYPAWHVFRNGASLPARAARADGLIAIPVPQGPSTIDVRYTQSLDQTAGDVLTLLALAGLLLVSRPLRRGSRSV